MMHPTQRESMSECRRGDEDDCGDALPECSPRFSQEEAIPSGVQTTLVPINS